MRFGPFLIAAAAFAAGSAPAQTVSPQEAPRTLDFELREGDTLVATPTVRIQVGRPTAVSVGDYSLRLRMVRAVATDGTPAPYVIRSSVYRSEGGWQLVGSPTLTVGEGQQAQARFAANDGKELSLAVSVR